METQKECSMHKTALLLSDPWTMLIIRDVLEGPKRFCDLERSLEGISTRTLTLKLKKLKTQGLLQHDSDGLYHPTTKSRGLRPVENAMRAYGKKYL